MKPQEQLTQRWRQHQQNIQQQQYFQEHKQHKGILHAYTVNLQAQCVEPAPQQQRQAVKYGMQGLEAPISAPTESNAEEGGASRLGRSGGREDKNGGGEGGPETGGEDEDMERGQQPPAPQRQHSAHERNEHLEVVVPVGCVSGQQVRVQAPGGLVVVTQSVHMDAPPCWCISTSPSYVQLGWRLSRRGQLSAYILEQVTRGAGLCAGPAEPSLPERARQSPTPERSTNR